MKYSLEYFSKRVLYEVEGWPTGVLAAYARSAELLSEFGPLLRMPYSRALGKGLFELRLRAPEGDGRVLYCFRRGRQIVMLHAFIKKTQATPRADLKLARRRMKEVHSSEE